LKSSIYLFILIVLLKRKVLFKAELSGTFHGDLICLDH
jgi:hypothetical protein